MQALITLLPQPYYQKVLDIWSVLEERFACESDFSRPEPHFTWQYAEHYDEAYASRLKQICHNLDPIEIETNTVCSFTPDGSILFVRIIPTEKLKKLHQTLWEALEEFGKEPSLLYQPESWIPHITLSMHGDTNCDTEAVREYLHSLDVRWKFTIDRLTMLKLDENNAWQEPKHFLLGS